MNEVRITLPQEINILKTLSIGDKVLLTGTIFTARDKAHHLLAQLIDNNKPLPFKLKDSVVYYTGPVIDKNTGLFTSAGPTTSSRMDTLSHYLIEAGVKGFIGKGPRGENVNKLLVKHQAVYLSTIGGAGVYLAERIKKVKLIAFPELKAEAIYELTVEDFPCYVAVDCNGDSIFT